MLSCCLSCQVDPTGVSKVLQRDDRESTLLTAFLKSGCWLLPEVTEQWLDMELEDDSSSHKQLVSQYKVSEGAGEVYS